MVHWHRRSIYWVSLSSIDINVVNMDKFVRREFILERFGWTEQGAVTSLTECVNYCPVFRSVGLKDPVIRNYFTFKNLFPVDTDSIQCCCYALTHATEAALNLHSGVKIITHDKFI